MNVGLTYDLQTDPHDERQAEFDPPRTIDAVAGALERLGHQVVRLGNAHALLADPDALQRIDLAFNLAEGSWGRCREAWVPLLLELWKVAYVGSDPLALSVGLDKHLSKRLALSCGIPTPPWIAVNDPDKLPDTLPFAFPVIVKPRYEGSGIGIDAGAIVREHQALRARVQWLFAKWREPILIEAFIPFGELTICVIGNDPPVAYPAIQRPLDSATRLSYHVVRTASAKWEAPLELDDGLETQARRIALRMFEVLGCHDMARVDLRVDHQGRPWFLEINPLPSFDPEGSLGLLAEHLGFDYPRLIGQILEAARLRLTKSAHPAHARTP